MMTKNDKERFNKRISGEVQISADIRVSDLMTEGAAYVTITESPLYERVCQYTWICPYISRHLLSLNPLLACCRRYSRGER